jgi:hypothetical protein
LRFRRCFIALKGMRMKVELNDQPVATPPRAAAAGQHDNYGFALAAQPGES